MSARVGKLKQHFILSASSLYNVYQREICVTVLQHYGLSTCIVKQKSPQASTVITVVASPQIVTNHCSIFMYMCLSHDLYSYCYTPSNYQVM